MGDLIRIPDTGTTFLHGPAGAGKTTAAVARLEHLLRAGVHGRSILVTAPQRSLLAPYRERLRLADLPAGEAVETQTLGGIARSAVSLVWPTVAGPAGFARPDRPPVFLPLETAQYHMMVAVKPLVEREGFFEGVTIPRHRVYSQILDGLNKAALVGFPHEELGPRLASAWSGEARRRSVYHQVGMCASRFRALCLAHNLLDFSLQVEVLFRHLLPMAWCRKVLFGRYQHLIADNVEEETPAMHDLMRVWLPACGSALLVCDAEGGYRTFLGADPPGGNALREVSAHVVEVPESLVTSPGVRALEGQVARILGASPRPGTGEGAPSLEVVSGRLFPQMLDGVTQRVSALVGQEGLAASEVVILAPYLSDALRFALAERLRRSGVEARSLRPSRSLADEPMVRALMTWSMLGHPSWGIDPPLQDVSHALGAALEGLDPIRARLLAYWGRREGLEGVDLRPLADIPAGIHSRVGPRACARYERLRRWLERYREGTPAFLDHFLSRLFGEVLSQPGFGFHTEAREGRFDRSRVAAHLIASAARFRKTVGVEAEPDTAPGGAGAPSPAGGPGRAFVEMVMEGMIGGQFAGVGAWGCREAVLLAPATTFLLENRAVDVQVWMNAGNPGWWERPDQPLTHPHVLSRRWTPGRLWTDADEQASRREDLLRLLRGLLRRCRSRVVVAFSTLDERGFEERGPLLNVLQQALRDTGREA